MYNRSELGPILLVLLISEPLHHLLVLECRRMLDQDVAEIFMPICFTFWKRIYHTDMRLDLLDRTHSDTVDVWVLIAQVGSWPVSGDDVDVLIVIITVRCQIAFSLDIELAQVPQREGVHHTSSTSCHLRG